MYSCEAGLPRRWSSLCSCLSLATISMLLSSEFGFSSRQTLKKSPSSSLPNDRARQPPKMYKQPCVKKVLWFCLGASRRSLNLSRGLSGLFPSWSLPAPLPPTPSSSLDVFGGAFGTKDELQIARSYSPVAQLKCNSNFVKDAVVWPGGPPPKNKMLSRMAVAE